MARHRVEGRRRRQVHHLHPARRREVVRRAAAGRRGRGLHLRAAEEDQGRLRIPRHASPPRANKVTFNFNKPWSPALFDVGQLTILPEHIWSTLADPEKEANAKPVGTGPVHRGGQLPGPVLRAEEEPQLLAAGKAEDRRHQDARLRRERRRQPRRRERRRRLGAAVHPQHRKDLRLQGQGTPPVLVPAHRRHDQLAAQHHQGPLQRRGRPQGAEHGRRPRPGHQDRHERLRQARRLHRPVRRTTRTWKNNEVKDNCTWTKLRRAEGQRAPGQGRLRQGC